jgi:hypothetical protein
MNPELLSFKKRQLASLKDCEVIDDARAANIARVESEIRTIEGNPDDPRDGEISRLRERNAELEAKAKATADQVEKAALYDNACQHRDQLAGELDSAKREAADAAAALSAEREAHNVTRRALKAAAAKKPAKKK